MANYGDKIDKIVSDVSYLRGRFDIVIPQLQDVQKSQGMSIVDIKSKQDNMTGRVGIVGIIMGAIGGAILSFLTSKF